VFLPDAACGIPFRPFAMVAISIAKRPEIRD
jgi:hypothetical protein